MQAMPIAGTMQSDAGYDDMLVGCLISGIALFSIILLPPTAGDKAGFDPP